jgi:hypothetical protein
LIHHFIVLNQFLLMVLNQTYLGDIHKECLSRYISGYFIETMIMYRKTFFWLRKFDRVVYNFFLQDNRYLLDIFLHLDKNSIFFDPPFLFFYMCSVFMTLFFELGYAVKSNFPKTSVCWNMFHILISNIGLILVIPRWIFTWDRTTLILNLLLFFHANLGFLEM